MAKALLFGIGAPLASATLLQETHVPTLHGFLAIIAIFALVIIGFVLPYWKHIRANSVDDRLVRIAAIDQDNQINKGANSHGNDTAR